MFRPSFARAALVCCALLALAGCSSLRESLGLDEQSEGNVYVGVGVNAQVAGKVPTGAEPIVRIYIQTDAAGDVGGSAAERDGSSGATATANIDPQAVAKAISDLATTAVAGSPRAALLEQAGKAFGSGDVAKAKELAEEAADASNEAPVPPPAPAGDGG